MINKNELLDQLQEFDYFVINKLVDLESKPKRGIMQTSVYDKVDLCWNGSVFKFWSSKEADNNLYLNANIEKSEFNQDMLKIHIIDCPESVEIRCGKHLH